MKLLFSILLTTQMLVLARSGDQGSTSTKSPALLNATHEATQKVVKRHRDRDDFGPRRGGRRRMGGRFRGPFMNNPMDFGRFGFGGGFGHVRSPVPLFSPWMMNMGGFGMQNFGLHQNLMGGQIPPQTADPQFLPQNAIVGDHIVPDAGIGGGVNINNNNANGEDDGANFNNNNEGDVNINNNNAGGAGGANVNNNNVVGTPAVRVNANNNNLGGININNNNLARGPVGGNVNNNNVVTDNRHIIININNNNLG